MVVVVVLWSKSKKKINQMNQIDNFFPSSNTRSLFLFCFPFLWCCLGLVKNNNE